MESNITKATRDLSSKTDANIANTHRVLMSQIESTRNDLRLEIETNRHKLSLEMAQYHQQLMSQMAKNSQGPKQVLECPMLEGMLFGVVLLWIPLVCTMYLQAAFDLMLISTRVQDFISQACLASSKPSLGTSFRHGTEPGLNRPTPPPLASIHPKCQTEQKQFSFIPHRYFSYLHTIVSLQLSFKPPLFFFLSPLLLYIIVVALNKQFDSLFDHSTISPTFSKFTHFTAGAFQLRFGAFFTILQLLEVML